MSTKVVCINNALRNCDNRICYMFIMLNLYEVQLVLADFFRARVVYYK